MQSLTVDLNFAWGSGGSTTDVYGQTSFDAGNTWQDVVHYQFSTASARVQFNVTAMQAVTSAVTPTDGTLSGNTAVQGILGPQLRLKAVSAGTYSNTVLTANFTAR
jgi:hypothetical protein